MQNPSLSDEGHAEDIFGTHDYAAPQPHKKEFLPWHRPRKQYVRDRQWREQIEALLSEASPQGNTLKYLGLPGIDLLDLRYFHNAICTPKNLRLCFLGFNSDAAPGSDNQTELNISLDEVRRLPHIDVASEIIPDDFCRIASGDSIAWSKAFHLGPYDIVNLDLCDGFGKHPPGSLEDTHYNAVNQLLTLQAKNKNPWLLLLTTRVGRNHVHVDVLEKLLTGYLRNLMDCLPFQNASRESFSINDENTLRQASQTEDGLLSIFLIGLCKWFLGLAVDQQPPSTVKVQNVLGYRVYGKAEHEDLVSLAIKFEPTFIAGHDALALANQPFSPPNECSLAVEALGKISDLQDVDALLRADQSLLDAMTTDMASLLESARYDPAAYREWVRKKHQPAGNSS